MDRSQEVLAYLLQCIVESHAQRDGQYFRRLEKLQGQMNKMGNQAFDGKLSNLYELLAVEPKNEIMDLLPKESDHMIVEVYFWVENKSSGSKMLGEAWKIYLQQIGHQYHHEDFLMILQLFSQLLLFLKNHSLLTHDQIKTQYSSPHIMNYQIYTHNTLNTVEQPLNPHEGLSIHSLPSKYSIQRLCSSFVIEIQCYSQPDLSKLETEPSLISCKKKNLSETKTQESLKQKEQGKQSLFQIYDEEIDFIFLSKSNNSFTNSPKGSVKEVKFEKILVESEEFQILTLSKDDQFIQENQNLFKQLQL